MKELSLIYGSYMPMAHTIERNKLVNGGKKF